MWARIESSVVLEITNIDPDGRFHQQLTWLTCPEGVEPGWRYDNGKFEPPVQPITDRVAFERTWRDAKLYACEWMVNRHRDEIDMEVGTTLIGEQYSELLGYRQRLRDWPVSAQFPNVAGRPTVPDWLPEYIQ